MITVIENCILAKNCAPTLCALSTEEKNRLLSKISSEIKIRFEEILEANRFDLEANSDKPKHILDRLMLTKERIESMSVGLDKLVELPDPIGEVAGEWDNYAGLHLKKVRVPLGVIGIIYEARPNVTVDAV